MKLSTVSVSLLSLSLTSAVALPAKESSTKLQARQDRGSYTIAELGNRKRQVTAAGADTFDLAIAMLESEKMTADYAYGDNKSQDSANFGIFKQNWGMLRVCCSKFKGQSQANYNNGAALNSDLNADVKCLNECQSYYGLDKWVGGHRNGASGLSNLNTQDIKNYRDGVNYIQSQLMSQPNGLTSDVRYWIYVVPI